MSFVPLIKFLLPGAEVVPEDLEKVLEEIDKLLVEGFREIILIGINLGDYERFEGRNQF